MAAATETPQIALARVDDLLNKVFVSGLALLFVDVIQNAFRQIQYLNPFWFWLTFTSFLVTVVGATLAAFRFGNTRYWYRAMVIVLLFTMLTWGYQMLDSQALPQDYKPWIWWALGPVTLAALGAWSRKIAYLALIGGPMLWLVVSTSSQGGSTPIGFALQDSLYTFFFSTALAMMAAAIQDRAKQVDSENGLAIQATLARARSKVLNRERAIFNSILHDKVLTTLELASAATTEKTKREASAAAEDAIGRITRELERTANPPQHVKLDSISEAFVEAIHRRVPEFKVSLVGSSPQEIPFQAVAAIVEGTLLAATNSMAHAPRATQRKVNIRLSQRGIKVVVSDNGSGFRMSNVHKTALGVRWTIFKRLESHGVKARLDSKPGAGTTWVFEWHA
jgi:signal transduction histidine kinase